MKRLLAAAVAALSAAAVAVPAPPAGATPGPQNAPEYWFDSWKIPTLWAAGARGQGITIGEIDTGVNADVEGLRGKVLPGTDFGDSGGDGRVDRDEDEFGHGTAMASIMVASPSSFGIEGIAPDAKILPVAVPLMGTTDAAPDDRLADAIRWATNHGANIINMSLGGKRNPRLNSQSCPPDEQNAIFDALRKGVILVAAVGNTGPTHNTVEEPGVCLGVISVGAVDETGTVATFSSREPYLTVSAPGVNIPSLSRVAGEAYSGDGSSQASAIVSAVLALTWSKYRSLPARQIVTRLLNTLDDARAPASPSYGYGIVDGYRAVTASVPASAPNPVYSTATPFMARAKAFGRTPTRPRTAARSALGGGGYGVDGPPRLTAPRVVGGGVLALAGLLALVALGVIGRRRSRQYAAAALTPAGIGGPLPPAGYAPAIYAPEPAQPRVYAPEPSQPHVYAPEPSPPPPLRPSTRSPAPSPQPPPGSMQRPHPSPGPSSTPGLPSTAGPFASPAPWHPQKRPHPPAPPTAPPAAPPAALPRPRPAPGPRQDG